MKMTTPPALVALLAPATMTIARNHCYLVSSFVRQIRTSPILMFTVRNSLRSNNSRHNSINNHHHNSCRNTR